MTSEPSHAFLFLNASVVWFVVSAILMKICRLKSLVLVLIIAPFVIGSTFRHIAGMPQLIGFYGTSILYGSLGIIGGILYIEYARAKAYFKRASKTSFLARGVIGLSSIYLLTFFAQKILTENPLVAFALNWIEGGEQVQELLTRTNFSGVYLSSSCILGGISVLVINRYREHHATKNRGVITKNVDE